MTAYYADEAKTRSIGKINGMDLQFEPWFDKQVLHDILSHRWMVHLLLNMHSVATIWISAMADERLKKRTPLSKRQTAT